MKNKYNLLFACLAFVLSMNAQNDTKSNTRTGIKAGYNLSAITYDGEGETGQRHGFHAGIYGNTAINDLLAVQIEILYSQQGYQLENDSGTFTQKLNYINLPLMLQLYPMQHFYLEGGAQIGWAISHKETFDSGFNIFDTETEFNPDTFDWGFNFGGGVNLASGLNLGVRYHLGMGEIYDEGGPKNRIWSFSIGIDF